MGIGTGFPMRSHFSIKISRSVTTNITRSGKLRLARNPVILIMEPLLQLSLIDQLSVRSGEHPLSSEGTIGDNNLVPLGEVVSSLLHELQFDYLQHQLYVLQMEVVTVQSHNPLPLDQHPLQSHLLQIDRSLGWVLDILYFSKLKMCPCCCVFRLTEEVFLDFPEEATLRLLTLLNLERLYYSFLIH